MKQSRPRNSEKGNVKNVGMEISSNDDLDSDGDEEVDEADERF